MNIPENCKGCGKCCYWESLKDIPKHIWCPSCKDSMYLIYGRCQYLNENNECDIYEGERPDGCSLIQRGSDDCISFLNQTL